MTTITFVFRLCFLALIYQLAATTLHAQAYQWRCTLPFGSYAVAFNPLSHGRVVFAATPVAGNVFRSDDRGETWQSSAPLDDPSPEIHQIYCVPSDTNIVLAITPRELYRSADGGKHWSVVQDLGGIDGEAIAYHAATDAIYYGRNFAGPIYRSLDHGATWVQTGAANSTVTLCTIGVSPDAENILLAGSENGIIDRSTNEGAEWTVTYPSEGEGTPAAPEIPKIVFSDRVSNVAFATRWRSLDHSIVKTTDRGLNWITVGTPERHAWALEIDQRASRASSEGPLHLWTGLFFQGSQDTTTGGLIQETTDGGTSWHTTGFPKLPRPVDVWVIKHDTASGTLVAATDSGVFIGYEPGSGVQARAAAPSEISIYPNPASARTTISLPTDARSARLLLFSVTGCIMLDKMLSGSNVHSLDLSNLPAGVYTAYVSSLGKRWVGRIVKFENQ